MLTREDNDTLVRTGPGTPMGALLRRYWMPVVSSAEVEPGGRVKRVQILGERLVVHRTPRGRPGLVAEFCPHRPNEPADSSFASKVRTTAYPCVERGGVVWAWMGPGAPPQHPESFCVRSASLVLPPGQDWVEPAKPLVLVRPTQTLTLA